MLLFSQGHTGVYVVSQGLKEGPSSEEKTSMLTLRVYYVVFMIKDAQDGNSAPFSEVLNRFPILRTDTGPVRGT